MSDSDLDKSNPASPYKLEKARQKGSVAKSQDISFLALMLALTCTVFGLGDSLTHQLSGTLRWALSQAFRTDWDAASVNALLGKVTLDIAMALGPPLGLILVVAVAIGIWQVGFTISTEPLKPDFNRINPATGFKRLFSMRSIYELFRNIIKLAVVVMLVGLVGQSIIQEVIVLSMREPSTIMSYLIHKTGNILAMLTAVLALLALLDLAYSRWEFLKQMRMSTREVKDEHKQREGDPRIKSRLRELRMAWLKKGMSMKRVRDADVLITNPTHFAVAIAYKRGSMPAPQILSKGAGDMAHRMRTLAQRYGIPIVENPPLARSLYKLAEPGDHLPEQHFTEVAKILVWVFAARARQK